MLSIGTIQVLLEQMICSSSLPLRQPWFEDSDPTGERWGRFFNDTDGVGRIGSGYYSGTANGDGSGGVSKKDISGAEIWFFYGW